jgi:hypothetical protein
MKLKLWIAGAIVTIIAICVMAVSATSMASQEQAADNMGDGTPDSQVSTADAVAMPSDSPESAESQQTAQSVCSISGRIIEGRGSGLADKPVTLHVMGYNYSGGQVAGSWEVYSLTTTTRGEADAGSFVFDNVIVTPETQYWYASSYTTLPNGMTIYGFSNNFTLSGDASLGFIVLADPLDFDPDPA